MRKLKCIEPLFDCVNLLVVEPNNSLTPRQILMQYGQGVSFSGNEPSDDIDDDNFSDDDMVDKVVVFEDELEAREFMNQPMYPIDDKRNDSNEVVESKPGDQPSLELGDTPAPREE